MEKNILNEIDQMKYLFGYKPGKVISEQVTPTTLPSSGTTSGDTKPTFPTINGTVYKFPGITDNDKLLTFTRLGDVKNFVNFMGIDPGWLNKYEKVKAEAKNNPNGIQRNAMLKSDKLYNLWAGTDTVLWDIARLGITPDKFKDKGIQSVILRLPIGEYIQFATNQTSEEGPVMTLDNYFNKLSELVGQRMQEIRA